MLLVYCDPGPWSYIRQVTSYYVTSVLWSRASITYKTSYYATSVLCIEAGNARTSDHLCPYSEPACMSLKISIRAHGWLSSSLRGTGMNSFHVWRISGFQWFLLQVAHAYSTGNTTGNIERKREMFYLTTHSTHFIYGYMASDIWLRTILIVRKETRCRHIGYSYRVTGFLLYAPYSYTSRITHTTAFVTPVVELAGTRNSSWVHPMKDRSGDPSHHERTLYLWATGNIIQGI